MAGLAAAWFGAAGAWAVVTAIGLQEKSYTSLPFFDAWDEFGATEAAFAGKLNIDELWAQHNEHRILLSRVQDIVDAMVFGGTNAYLLVSVFVSSVLLAVALAWPIQKEWRSMTLTLGFFAFTLADTLSPGGFENLTGPFQVGFVQTYTFGVAAIVFSICWLRREQDRAGHPHWLALAVVILCAAGSTCSLAAGLGVWPILVLVLLLRRAGRISIGAVAIAGIAATYAYLNGYQSAAGHTSIGYLLAHPGHALRYAFLYLGHPAQSWGTNATEVCGGVSVALWVLIAVVAVRRRAVEHSSATFVGAGVGAWIMLIVAQTVWARIGLGLGQALSSRYEIVAGVFWASIAVGLVPIVVRAARSVPVLARVPVRVIAGVLAVGWIVAALAANQSVLPAAASLNIIQTRTEPLLVSFVVGVQDDSAILATYPVATTRIYDELGWLESERIGPWGSGLGEALKAAMTPVPRVGALPSCGGSVDGQFQVIGGQSFTGWLTAPSGTSASREVDVVSAGGASLGAGIIDRYRPDVRAAGQSSSNYTGFVAYARSDRAPADLVILRRDSDTPVCAFAIPPKQP